MMSYHITVSYCLHYEYCTQVACDMGYSGEDGDERLQLVSFHSTSKVTVNTYIKSHALQHLRNSTHLAHGRLCGKNADAVLSLSSAACGHERRVPWAGARIYLVLLRSLCECSKISKAVLLSVIDNTRLACPVIEPALAHGQHNSCLRERDSTGHWMVVCCTKSRSPR